MAKAVTKHVLLVLGASVENPGQIRLKTTIARGGLDRVGVDCTENKKGIQLEACCFLLLRISILKRL